MRDVILDRILDRKREEVMGLPGIDRAALRDLPRTRGFAEALRRPASTSIRVIAECKKASPSKGLLAKDYDPVLIAYHYVMGGANCISVLTDRDFFQGSLDDLIRTRAAVPLPVLRKDFTIDPRQIAEARLAGADAILLIAACLGDGELRDLQGFAREIGLDVLVEVHDADEAARALTAQASLIGVNNRDLRDFTIDLGTTLGLLPGLLGPGRVVVSESGISHRDHCRILEEAGVDAVLVGEALMTSDDPVAGLRRLRGQLMP